MSLRLDVEDVEEDASLTTTTPERWSWLARIFVGCLCTIVAVSILLTTRKLLLLYAFAVAAVPFFAAIFIIRRLGDDTLSFSAVIEQIFYGAIPAYLCAVLVELLLVLVSLSILLSNELRTFYLDLGPNANQQEINSKLQSFLQSVPLWKILTLAVFGAFILAAGVEESAKLLVGLRFKRYKPLSPYNTVMLVVAGALGLAATEHTGVVLNVLLSTASKNILLSTAYVFFRAVLAFPVHMGCALLVGVALAKKICLKLPVRIYPSFIVAVLAHGTFDAVGMIAIALDAVKRLPKWANSFGVVGADVIITLLLVGLCRREYKSLQQSGYESVELSDQV